MCIVGACMTNDAPVGETAGAEQALSSDGPFASVDELVNFWNNTSTGGAATEIFVNGHRKLFRSGFGPEFLKQYFVCAGGSSIYATCPTGFFDGFASFPALVSRSPSTATITKNGTPFRTGTNQFEFENIKTCSVDVSLNGAVYFKVDSYTNGFVPYSSNCYP
jgi:hypothetical protein